MVFSGKVSACLWLPTCYCNKAIALAFIALGHIAVTEENFAFFGSWLCCKPSSTLRFAASGISTSINSGP